MLDYLRRTFHWLSDEAWQRYLGCFHRLEVPAKTVLLREGEVATRVFQIEQGCVRGWFENNGHDTTSQFFLENQGFSSIESFARSTPSFFTFEAIEPSVLYWISKADLATIAHELAHEPRYYQQLIDFLLGRQLHYMQEFLSLIKDTPTQRYQHLLAQQPQLVRRVPAQYIASYLGITPVSLSRIKGKLLRQGK